MSDLCVLQSNLFHVKKESTFLYLMECICGIQEDPHVSVSLDEGENKVYSFSLHGSLLGIKTLATSPDCEYDANAFEKLVSRLQRCVADGDAIILTESADPDFEDSLGYGTIITANHVEELSLEDLLIRRAREILGKPEWETDILYDEVSDSDEDDEDLYDDEDDEE